MTQAAIEQFEAAADTLQSTANPASIFAEDLTRGAAAKAVERLHELESELVGADEELRWSPSSREQQRI